MNNDTFLIEESDLELAKSICNEITDKKLRNRSYRNILASKIAKQYFTEIELDVASGLHNVDKVLEQLDISDVYINGSYIDVRLYFDANEILVPKQHFDNELLPVAYMFIKVDEELSSAIVSGFITPENIDRQLVIDNHFKIEENDLQSYYDVESLIETNYDEPEDNIENLILNYIESSYIADNEFYNKLLKSESSRTLLIDCAKADDVLKKVFVSDNTSEEEQEILNDNFEEALEPIELLEESSNDFELSMDNEENLLEQFDTEPLDLTESSIEKNNESNEDLLEIIEESDINETNLDIISGIEDPLLEFSEEAGDQTEILSDSQNTIITEESFVDIIDDTELELKSEFDTNAEIEINLEAEQYDNDIEENETINDADLDLIQELDSLTEGPINEYATITTPSLESIENEVEESSTEEKLIIEETNSETAEQDAEQNIENNSEEIIDIEEQNDKEDAIINFETTEDSVTEEQINNLFGENTADDAIPEENIIEPKRNNKNGLLIIPFVIIILGLVIYYASKFVDVSSFINKSPELPQTTSLPKKEPVKITPKDDNIESMPIETVENVPTEKVVKPKETKPNLIIEQNLNTPVSIENLTVNWEVPSSYVSNTTAKRYLSRIGKIIQLNLKADLLLQNKSPITNKIMIELEFNKASGGFNVKSMIASSGEESIDNIIIDTVKNVLDMNLKTNMTIFDSMSGNPVLVIRL